MNEAQLERLRAGATIIGFQLTDLQVTQFNRFAELLREWNERINLTRIKEEDWVDLHFLDSLIVAPTIRGRSAKTVVDVGTGAGFPGVPLAIVLPDIRFTLIDGTLKRIRFIQTVIDDLGLGNCAALHRRAEQLAEERARFDVATARAVAPLPKLAPLLVGLLKPNGVALALKSAQVEEEIQGGPLTEVRAIHRAQVPGTDISRAIVELAYPPKSAK